MTMTTPPPPLLVERDEKLLILTMNRPQALNSYTYEMVQMFIKTLKEVQGDENIGAILIRSEGRAFSAGMDIKQAPEDAQKSEEFIEIGRASCRERV